MEKTGGSSAFLIIGVTGMVLAAIIIPFVLLNPSATPFSQIISVGPVWESNSWTCASDSDFIVHGTLRGLENSQLEIFIENVGTQSLYSLNPGQMETFSVGSTGGNEIVITRIGTVTGFLTIQTSSSANASCTQQ